MAVSPVATRCLLLLVSVSIATGLTTSGLTTTSTPSEECLETEDDYLCNCHGKADVNTSLVRLENKTARLEAKMGALLRHQEAAFNSSIEQLKESVNTFSAQIERQVSELQRRMELRAGLRCPGSWHYDNDTDVCLKRFEDRVPWDVAKERCESVSIGGRLAVLDSSAKIRFAHNTVRAGDDFSSVVGARRDDGQFKWLDGHDVTSGWAPGQPSGGGDCVILRSGRTHFSNHGCSSNYYYMCEIPLI